MTFVVIDGLDGSGKSTQAKLLLEYLENRQKTVVLRVHPEQDNYFGIKARHFLFSRGKSAHFISAVFYMIDVIRSILLFSWRNEDYIVFVRYLMGTAYLPAPMHKVAYNFFALIVPKTDFKFFLDIDPQEAATRIYKSRQKQEMFEGIDDLKKVRPKALSLAYSSKWKIIDSNRPAVEVSATIRLALSI